jgi:hypothetical protein
VKINYFQIDKRKFFMLLISFIMNNLQKKKKIKIKYIIS